LGKQERCSCVPEVVEADVRETGSLQERGERTLPEVRGVDRAARLRGEDQALVLTEPGELAHLPELALAVCLKDFQGAGREADGAAALFYLGHPESDPIAFVGACERAPDTDSAPLEVNVGPFKP
jgi:hypothetical protein